MNWRKALLDGVDQARHLLPILLVGGLAGYTWWLVQSAPTLRGPGGPGAAASTPDYELAKAVVERFDAQGVRMSILRGTTMSHVVQGDRLTVASPQIIGLDPKGQHLQAVAQLGQYAGDDQVVTLSGQARVVVRGPQAREGPMMFEGDALTINTGTRVLTSALPVMLTSDDGVVRGSSLRHDGVQGVTTFGGRVHGQLKAGLSP